MQTSREADESLINILWVMREKGSMINVREEGRLGGSVGRGVERLTSAQVMISRFMSSSPAFGCLLSVWSLLGILCPPLCCTSPTCAHSLSLKNK